MNIFMVKEELKEKEAIVYSCLRNDLKNKKLAHSYLFCGDKNPLKKKTAILLAQSIIENDNDFACEECDTCKRIANNNHLDVLYIDGQDELIKKENVENLLREFSKTAAEADGKKVYIINNVNNSTTKVLNMILKFMEEPSNDNTYGIFISDDENHLLETVKSRCEMLKFTSIDFSEIRQEYLDNNFEEMDAYLLSELFHEYKEIDDTYLNAKDFVYKTIDSLNKPKYLPVLFMNEFYTLKEFKEVSKLYLDIMIRILDDSISNRFINDSEYDSLLNKVKPYSLNLLEEYLDIKTLMDSNQSLDYKLLLDKLCCKIVNEKIG